MDKKKLSLGAYTQHKLNNLASPFDLQCQIDSHETFERHPISPPEALLEQYKHTNAKATNEPRSRLPVIGGVLNPSKK